MQIIKLRPNITKYAIILSNYTYLKKTNSKKFLWRFNSIATKTLNTYAFFGIIPIETEQKYQQVKYTTMVHRAFLLKVLRTIVIKEVFEKIQLKQRRILSKMSAYY